MKTYIALLRGINVAGQKKIKMAELKLQLEDLPMTNIQTYIQSGNLIFDAEKSITELKDLIEEKIKKDYGFDVPTLVLEVSSLEAAIESYPFEQADESKRYFTFLDGEPNPENIEKLAEKDYSPELYKLDGKVIYLYPFNGFGKAKLNNNLLESKLKVQATTRNWKTVSKLIELSK